jgi:dephospho-CoA kinase
MPIERPRRAAAADRLFRIGLVGRAGSGKTTVARVLASDGAEVIEADRVGHQVTDQDPEVRAALEREYGPDVYRGDGTLDRARVAARVFTDPEARARLDRLVHPRIVRRIHDRFQALADAGWQGVVLVDAALMLEWGLERDLDAVIAVVAPESVQRARLAAARGWSEDEAARRIAVQRSNQAFAEAADVTIENTGSEDDLARAARAAVAQLIAGR